MVIKIIVRFNPYIISAIQYSIDTKMMLYKIEYESDKQSLTKYDQKQWAILYYHKRKRFNRIANGEVSYPNINL